MRDKNHTDIMAWLVEASGGVCVSCSGTDHLAFHHMTLGDKNFTICEETSRPIEELLAETKDCVLLCYHCHFRHHAGIDYGVGHRIVNRRSQYKEDRNQDFKALMEREHSKRAAKALLAEYDKKKRAASVRRKMKRRKSKTAL